MSKTIPDAKLYFRTMPRFAGAAASPTAPTSYTDKDGMFLFNFSDPGLLVNQDLAKRVDDAKYYLKGFMALVTGKLLSDQANVAFSLPPSKVLEVASNLPLLGSFISSEATNHQETTQLQFSTTFLKAGLDLVIGNDASIVTDTLAWLTSIGGDIKISHDAKAQSYNVTIFSAMIDVVGAGLVTDIEAKFRIAGTSLAVSDVENSIANCIQTRSFTLNFEADLFTASVDLDALKDPATKADLDSFISQGQVSQIDKSKNYFGVSKPVGQAV
jgi:hypothetical protein